MIAIITEIGLIITAVLSIFLSIVTLNNPVRSKPIGRAWIAFNTSVFLWSSLWMVGAFYCKTETWQWFSIYLASLCAIPMPPLFLCFVTALLNKPLSESKLIKLGVIVSVVLA